MIADDYIEYIRDFYKSVYLHKNLRVFWGDPEISLPLISCDVDDYKIEDLISDGEKLIDERLIDLPRNDQLTLKQLLWCKSQIKKEILAALYAERNKRNIWY
jgi:hypothetical protein